MGPISLVSFPFPPSSHTPEKPSTPVCSLLSWTLVSPLSGNLPCLLVNCLSQKFLSAATLGPQAQHDKRS